MTTAYVVFTSKLFWGEHSLFRGIRQGEATPEQQDHAPRQLLLNCSEPRISNGLFDNFLLG
jgi:hypothetical protein